MSVYANLATVYIQARIPLFCTYDSDADAAYVYFDHPLQAGVAERVLPLDLDHGMLNLDLDAHGRIAGLEIISARKRLPPSCRWKRLGTLRHGRIRHPPEHDLHHHRVHRGLALDDFWATRPSPAAVCSPSSRSPDGGRRIQPGKAATAASAIPCSSRSSTRRGRRRLDAHRGADRRPGHRSTRRRSPDQVVERRSLRTRWRLGVSGGTPTPCTPERHFPVPTRSWSGGVRSTWPDPRRSGRNSGPGTTTTPGPRHRPQRSSPSARRCQAR